MFLSFIILTDCIIALPWQSFFKEGKILFKKMHPSFRCIIRWIIFTNTLSPICFFVVVFFFFFIFNNRTGLDYNRMGDISRTIYFFNIIIYLDIIYAFISGLNWESNKSWKYFRDVMHHRAHNYVYLKKSKCWFIIYLIMYNDNFMTLYEFINFKIFMFISISKFWGG